MNWRECDGILKRKFGCMPAADKRLLSPGRSALQGGQPCLREWCQPCLLGKPCTELSQVAVLTGPGGRTGTHLLA